MTPKQKRFIEAYTGNATKAAIAAGYSEKTAYSQGERLLRNVEISSAIQERENRQLSALVATRSERQSFWSRVMRDEAEQMRDRLRASELLAKASGDFLERVELTKPEPPIIQVVFTDEIDDEEEE